MVVLNEIKKYSIGNGLLKANILKSGNICDITYDNIIRINQLLGNNLEPNANNIFMRIEGENKYTRLIGIGSPSITEIYNNKVIYKGEFQGVQYHIVLTIIDNAFFFKVKLNSKESKKVTLFYGLDIAITNKYAIYSNEAYVCQYIDHQAFTSDNGYVICSKQNQENKCYLEQGSLSKNIAYCTDGYQFFGKEYKKTNIPIALLKDKLESKVYQYEFAYIGLQTEIIDTSLDNENVFYGYFQNDFDEFVSKPLFIDKVKELYNTSITMNSELIEAIDEVKFNIDFKNTYSSNKLTLKEIERLYKNRKFIEQNNGELYSFFLDDYSHVILQDKEMIQERPSANLLLSQNYLNKEEVLADTNYMYGLFNSQITSGNTSFNKLLSHQKNSLNVQKVSGQRIFIKIDNEYKILCLPASYQTGLNYSRWIYKIKDDMLIITSFVSNEDSIVTTNIRSSLGREYDIVITNFITMTQNEYEFLYNLEELENGFIVKANKNYLSYREYPNLYFRYFIDNKFKLNNDQIFYTNNDSYGESIITISMKTKEANIVIGGSSFGRELDLKVNDFEKVKQLYNLNHEVLLNNFKLEIKGKEQNNIDAFNYLVRWYAHNALIHFSSPHGIEQCNGAAWGTRDVCQGPSEFFIALNRYDIVKDIIIELYKHQYYQNGNFPQWFMFDKYYNIQQRESHGDIIVWPGRLLAIYLLNTKDYDILDQMIEYTDYDNCSNFINKESILKHLIKETNNIEKNFIEGTFLSCYGGGDWDDTLQPAHHEYALNMVSGWTVPLTYEMYNLLGKALIEYNKDLANDYNEKAEKIKKDYYKYLIKDDVPAGFIHFLENKEIHYIIHPSDKTTNIKYRLLPFNRGMISEMFDDLEVATSLKVINEHLKYPDGVRLMDRTITYKGGKNTYFQRAEKAANFGREIGLQYCHAHIRYCEALSKVGLAEQLYDGLLTIEPITLLDKVKNADYRQRNLYYSSSDGAFNTRYEAMEKYKLLITQEVLVKGGWRLYSSGPGIYIYQLICNMLGLRIKKDEFIIDPVIPKELNGLEFKYRINDKNVTIKYIINDLKSKVVINGQEVPHIEEKRKYRTGGMIISNKYLKNENIIEVYIGDNNAKR